MPDSPSPTGVQAQGAAGVPTPQAFDASTARRVRANLLWLVVFGVLESLWITKFTDAWGVVGGLLGLGGIFAWIAFVSKVLTEETTKDLQRWFERVCLRSRWTGVIVIGIGVLHLMIAANFGTIRLDATLDERQRSITIETLGDATTEPTRVRNAKVLDGNGTLNLFVPTPAFGGVAYRVKLSGLPSLVVELHALRVVTLRVPARFTQRPVLLMRPKPGDAGDWSKNPQRLLLTLGDGTAAEIPEYRGQSVWVGCDAGTTIPAPVIDRWRLALTGAGRPETELTRWMQPLVLFDTTAFAAHDKIRVTIPHPDPAQKPLFERTIVVSDGLGTFPQEVVFE